jgi:hypothetical protein
MASEVFFDYYTDDRPPRNLIRDWYALQDDEVRIEFDATLRLLEAMPDWTATDIVKPLEAEHVGLTEIVIDIKKKRPFRHIRPVGIWNLPERVFILLLGCEKKGRIYIPPNAFGVALKHKARLDAGRGAIDGHI